MDELDGLDIIPECSKCREMVMDKMHIFEHDDVRNLCCSDTCIQAWGEYHVLLKIGPPCALCQKPGCIQKCGKCGKVYYCTRECQVGHWKLLHKHFCGKVQQKRGIELSDFV